MVKDASAIRIIWRHALEFVLGHADLGLGEGSGARVAEVVRRAAITMHHSVSGNVTVAAPTFGNRSLRLGLVVVGLLCCGLGVLLLGLPLFQPLVEVVDGGELSQRLQLGLVLCGRFDLSTAPVVDLVAVPGKCGPSGLFESEPDLPLWPGKLISEGQICPVQAALALLEDCGYVGDIDAGEGALEEE